jgi:hypothetical protein
MHSDRNLLFSVASKRNVINTTFTNVRCNRSVCTAVDISCSAADAFGYSRTETSHEMEMDETRKNKITKNEVDRRMEYWRKRTS